MTPAEARAAHALWEQRLDEARRLSRALVAVVPAALEPMVALDAPSILHPENVWHIDIGVRERAFVVEVFGPEKFGLSELRANDFGTGADYVCATEAELCAKLRELVT